MDIPLVKFTQNLALEAGELLKTYFFKNDLQKNLKSDKTVLTEADLAADRFITQSILKEFPDDCLISEENNTSYPEHSPPAWIIDPLDGTANFSMGLHYWGVSIANIKNGIPETAALYFPIIDELYWAQNGKGAYLNNKKLDLTNLPGDQPVALFTRDSRLFRYYNVHLKIKPRILGSAAYNLCAVAKGVSIVGFETTPKLWDIAASWLVLKESGGVIKPFQANPFPLKPGKNYKKQDYPVLGAANQEILDFAVKRIKAKNLDDKQ